MYCECGCGQITNVCKHTISKKGVKKGEYFRYRRGHHARGENGTNWKGGRKYSYGYIMLFRPNHPKQIKNYVYEHRIIMEQHLGRFLNDGECVHHLNGRQDDNRIENLLLTTKSEHIKIYHQDMGKKTQFKKGYRKGIPRTADEKRRIGNAKRKWWRERNSQNT